jgi:hypothetical protein
MGQSHRCKTNVTAAGAMLWCVFMTTVPGVVAAAEPLDRSVAQGKKLLYVMNYREVDLAKKEDPPRPDLVKMKEAVLNEDWKVVAHLKSLGFNVATCDELADAKAARGKDLVVISESVNAYEIADKYTLVTIPVIVWENDVLDDMHMTGKRLRVDYGTQTKGATALQLFNAPDPLSAGLAAGTHEILRKPAPINWGRPGLGASIIATLPDQPDKVAIFAYEKGATMEYDYTAPARRVGLFPNRDYFENLTPEGLALFDAAFFWAVSPPPVTHAESTGKQALYIMNRRNLELAKTDVPADPKRLKRLQKAIDNEQKAISRLQSLGFTVRVADEHPGSDVVTGADLIVISNSVNAAEIPERYASLSIPIVTWASALYPVLHLTGNAPAEDFGTTGTVGGKDGDRFASIVNAFHPLAAKLSAQAIQDLYTDNEFITNYGKPALGAINIAVIEGYPDRRLVFAYEKGASMANDMLAPARRVAYFVNTEDFGELQPAGLALFDAAMLWAAKSPK